MSAITSTGLALNSNNICPLTAPSGLSTVSATTAAHRLPLNHMSPSWYRQPMPLMSPTAVDRETAVIDRLPSPLVPCPHPPSSTAGSSVSSYMNQQQPFVATTSVVNGTRPNQLPVYFMPQGHPNAIPQRMGYVVPFCRPGFTPRPGNLQPVGLTQGAVLHNNTNSNQQMHAGMFQQRFPPSYPLRNGLPPTQACIISAQAGIIPPAVSHISSSRTDVPLNSLANPIAVTSSVPPAAVTNGAAAFTSPELCMSLNDMALNDNDFSLLQDAIKDEQAAFDVSRNMPVKHFPGCSGSDIVTSMNHPVETASAESDSSLSDWSIIELPSPPMMSSVGAAVQDGVNAMKEIPVTSLASSSLMHFNADSGRANVSNSVCSGQRVNQFQAQKSSTACIPQPGSVFVSLLYFV